MIIMTELKKCPFCGDKAHFEQTRYGTDNGSVVLGFQIRCIKCGATAPKADGYIAFMLTGLGDINAYHDDRDKACEAWNRRADNG